MKTLTNRCVLLASIILVSGCASSGKVSNEPSNPVVGAWEYVIESPEGLFTGDLLVTENEDGLQAYISEAQEENTIEAESVEFDQETQTLSFSFDNPEFGRMNVSLTLSEQEMRGMLHAVQYSLDVPMVVTPSEQ